jgi:hypothetical protein
MNRVGPGADTGGLGTIVKEWVVMGVVSTGALLLNMAKPVTSGEVHLLGIRIPVRSNEG